MLNQKFHTKNMHCLCAVPILRRSYQIIYLHCSDINNFCLLCQGAGIPRRSAPILQMIREEVCFLNFLVFFYQLICYAWEDFSSVGWIWIYFELLLPFYCTLLVFSISFRKLIYSHIWHSKKFKLHHIRCQMWLLIWEVT